MHRPARHRYRKPGRAARPRRPRRAIADHSAWPGRLARREHLFAVVFLGAIVDAIGIPVPGRIMLITAGSMTDQARDHGTGTVLVIAVAVVGTVAGDHVGYLLGRLMGRGFLDRYGRRLRTSGPRLVTADRTARWTG